MGRVRIAAILSLVLAGSAFAFGVDAIVKNVGAEHQRITRAAVDGLEPQTFTLLAGDDGERGAVGSSLTRDAPTPCRGGDLFASDGQQRALEACRQAVFVALENAVAEARVLAPSPQSADVALDCRFDRTDAGAKCRVLQQLGLAFQLAQDFYAYSNWVDHPAAEPFTAQDLPGLSHRTRALWLDPRRAEPFPPGLMMGDAFAKDRGPIGQGRGGAGTTPRGAVNGNFARAVAAAVDDTRDKWAYFKERLRTVYGVDAGGSILCAISTDVYSSSVCAARTRQAAVCSARRALYIEGDAPDAPVNAPPSAEELARAEALWVRLRPTCQLEEASLIRDTVKLGKTADRGRAIAKQSGVNALALWDACPAEAQFRLELFEAENKAMLRDLDHTKSSDVSEASRLHAAVYSDCIVAARIRRVN